MIRQLSTWYKSPLALKHCYIEATVALFKARMLLLTRPFNELAPLLGFVDTEGLNSEPNKQAFAEIKLVACSVKTMAKYVPWQSKCLVQAIAAKNMLARRGIDTTLYLGVLKDGEDMKAHAWTRSGPYFITGGKGSQGYTVVKTFFNDTRSTHGS